MKSEFVMSDYCWCSSQTKFVNPVRLWLIIKSDYSWQSSQADIGLSHTRFIGQATVGCLSVQTEVVG